MYENIQRTDYFTLSPAAYNDAVLFRILREKEQKTENFEETHLVNYTTHNIQPMVVNTVAIWILKKYKIFSKNLLTYLGDSAIL